MGDKSPQVDRKKWDAAATREIADKMLDMEPGYGFSEVCKKYRLQPYQLYAWVGKAALQRAYEQKRRPVGHPAAIAAEQVAANTAATARFTMEDVLLLAEALSKRHG